MASAANQRGPMFKVVLLGEVNVGKTTFFLRMKNDRFINVTEGTHTIDSCSRVFNIKGDRVTLAVWDTAGVERFRTLTQNYYRNTHAVILMFSLDNPSSLHYLPKWVDDAGSFSPAALKILIGNKSDLYSSVASDTIKDFAAVYDCDLVLRLSSKTGEGFKEAAEKIAAKLLAEFKSKQTIPRALFGKGTIVDLTDQPGAGPQSQCYC
ncbi:ras-related protein Rab-1C [Lingula anatina]|uniref:Ras-related protein Rab-1C n=1 Tax=Lingula anatina TaxID=7574 RepID=A0A1S3IE68_LINAN|nr:ras-related protein Rab-1C [Lingula anatina]XP_013396529.1 ras-related protein Rab-1C [Lingula anatina]|eukprot:XP_013396527.1 ras-related protein Rab-1C [Lingula anatina]